MELREEILINSGYSDSDIVLTEGIRFFKNSKRLKKLAATIIKKAEKAKDKTQLKGVLTLAAKIKLIADEFEKVEIGFSSAKGEKKANLKEKYRSLRTKHIEIIKILRREEVKKALKILGLVGLVAGVVVLLLHLLSTNAVGTAMSYIATGKQGIPTDAAGVNNLINAAKSGEASAVAKIDAITKGIQSAKGIGRGFFESIGDWFGERSADITSFFTGTRPITSAAEKASAVRDFIAASENVKGALESQLNTGRIINSALAVGGGLTAAGGVALINKAFAKQKRNKLIARSKEAIEALA